MCCRVCENPKHVRAEMLRVVAQAGRTTRNRRHLRLVMNSNYYEVACPIEASVARQSRLSRRLRLPEFG